MRRVPVGALVRALLPGLLLVACGVVPEAGPEASEERLGTHEAAVCSSSGVTSLTITALSTELGELAGNGGWAVSAPANAVRLEYYIDGVLQSAEERGGASGTWYFSRAGVSCGPHTFKVQAYPMVIDSAGTRTTCWYNPGQSASQGVSEDCAGCAARSLEIVRTTHYGAGNYAYLKCPSGKKVLGGGCSDDFTSTALMSSRPWGDDGWICEFKTQPGSLSAYAMCGCRNALTVQKTVSSGVIVSATCPSGRIVVGGGCADNYTSTTLRSSYPEGNTGWTCHFASNPGSLTATAFCVDPSAIPGMEIVTATGLQSSHVICPAGKRVVGGGCRDNWGNSSLQFTMPWEGNSWVCSARESSANVTGYAICEWP